MSLYSKKKEKNVPSFGSFKTTLHSVGFESEDSLEYIKRGQYGFQFGLKFGKAFNGQDPILNYINYPYFKVSTDSEEKGNYLNNKSYKVDNVIQVTLENVEDCINIYRDNAVAYMTEFMTVFCNEEGDKTKSQVAKNLAYNFLRLGKTVNINYDTTPYYVEYGHYNDDLWSSAEGTNVSEPVARTNQKTGSPYYMGKYEEKDVYLSPVYFDGGTMYYREVNLEDYSAHIEDSDEQLEHQLSTLSNAVNTWIGNFFEYCFAYVSENNKGQVGYIFKTWQKNKKGDWYLQPVVNLKSLMIAKRSIKKGNKYESLFLKDTVDNPELSFYYSNVGQVKYIYHKESEGIYTSLLQFVFRDEPFNEGIEGFDKKVSYRGNSNPLLITTKPEVAVELEEGESEELVEESPKAEGDDIPF